jgi:hypothetical protein
LIQLYQWPRRGAPFEKSVARLSRGQRRVARRRSKHSFYLYIGDDDAGEIVTAKLPKAIDAAPFDAEIWECAFADIKRQRTLH